MTKKYLKAPFLYLAALAVEAAALIDSKIQLVIAELLMQIIILVILKKVD